MKQENKKSEKCAVCFFMDGRTSFVLTKTKDEKFNKELLEKTYFPKK